MPIEIINQYTSGLMVKFILTNKSIETCDESININMKPPHCFESRSSGLPSTIVYHFYTQIQTFKTLSAGVDDEE